VLCELGFPRAVWLVEGLSASLRPWFHEFFRWEIGTKRGYDLLKCNEACHCREHFGSRCGMSSVRLGSQGSRVQNG